MGTVLICTDIIEKMIAQARREFPLECCGLLAGAGQTIDTLYPTTNAKHSRREFFVPWEELLAFFKDLRRTDKQHLGIYHSHPATPARPSERDVREFHYPGISYWIVSLNSQEPKVRCFLWDGENFQAAAYQRVEC